MYLIIDEQYRIFRSPILSGYVRSQARAGNLSVVNLTNLQGINLDGSWSGIQPLPDHFAIDKEKAG